MASNTVVTVSSKPTPSRSIDAVTRQLVLVERRRRSAWPRGARRRRPGRAGLVGLGAVAVGVDALPAELLLEALGDELEIGLRVLLGDLGELGARRVQRRAVAVPGVRLAGVRVGAVGDELLPVAQDLDLVQRAVGRLEGGRHFRKRRSWCETAARASASARSATRIRPRSPNSSLATSSAMSAPAGSVMSMSIAGVNARQDAGIGAGPARDLGRRWRRSCSASRRACGRLPVHGMGWKPLACTARRSSVTDMDGIPPKIERRRRLNADGAEVLLCQSLVYRRRGCRRCVVSGLATELAGRLPTMTNIGLLTQPTRGSLCWNPELRNCTNGTIAGVVLAQALEVLEQHADGVAAGPRRGHKRVDLERVDVLQRQIHPMAPRVLGLAVKAELPRLSSRSGSARSLAA